MITRQTLHHIKKILKEDRYDVSAEANQVMHTLIDSNLQLLDQIDGGMDAKERERQIGLALVDLRTVVADLAETARDSMHPEYGDKALYVLDMVGQMLKAKGAAWTRKWDYYTPRIEEEFDSA